MRKKEQGFSICIANFLYQIKSQLQSTKILFVPQKCKKIKCYKIALFFNIVIEILAFSLMLPAEHWLFIFFATCLV